VESFAAVDVHYLDAGGARAAVVVAADGRFSTITAEHVALIPTVAPYQPGAFYLRELPAIHAALALAGPISLLVIDGYVDLDPDGRPGLGARVHAETSLSVVGVAKTTFRTATHAVPVHRGNSSRPLFVTAAGLGMREAATMVAAMAGPHRLPDALRRVDALARGRVPGP
jgi:deoxyribonuclease V